MLMPASSEFIALCQTQIALLVDGFGASQSAIYITEDPAAEGETALIPLAMFPETTWSEPVPFVLPNALQASTARMESLTISFKADVEVQDSANAVRPTARSLPQSKSVEHDFIHPLTVFESEPKQVALPLMHDDIMWGLMVVGRRRRWSEREQSQLAQIAHTLAISCVLDQRSQWLIQNRDQRRLLEDQQQKTLSTLLHQFRNPLTTLRTLGKLLLKRVKPKDANRALIASMVQESSHLEQLLRQFDDAIDLGDAALEPELIQPPALPAGAAWLTGGALTLQPCWLSEVLQPLLQAVAGRIDEQALQLHISIPEELPPVRADATALREVLGNLIDNAIKYTPAGGELWVSLQRRRSAETFEQWIQVSDTGPGIPSQDLEHIFERSYRGVQAATPIPGTGLGLAIAKDLINQMGGQIEVYSPALIRVSLTQSSPGSTFRVVLPEYLE